MIFSSLTITGNAVGSYWIFAKIPFFNVLNLLPATAYFILSIIFAIHDSIKNHNIGAAIFLPFIYLIIHMSYGAGMIYGFFKKSFTDKSVNSEFNKKKQTQ